MRSPFRNFVRTIFCEAALGLGGSQAGKRLVCRSLARRRGLRGSFHISGRTLPSAPRAFDTPNHLSQVNYCGQDAQRDAPRPASGKISITFVKITKL